MTTTKSPVVDANREAVLAWFTGKAREKAAAALDLLAESEALGEWVPKASRSVRAAFSKANVAIKIGEKNRAGLEAIGGYRSPEGHRGRDVSFILSFGNFWGDREVNFAAIHEAAPDADLKRAVRDCERFVRDFAPIAELLRRLDATRPKPVITHLGASPTITRLLKDLGLDQTVATTARVCPHHYERMEAVVKGVKQIITFIVLDWPPNTVHGASRYGSSRENDQCQACGHAIKVVDNWVPLLIDDAAGTPYSLWVGRDCSRTLFGIKVTGDFQIKAD